MRKIEANNICYYSYTIKPKHEICYRLPLSIPVFAPQHHTLRIHVLYQRAV
jgi:hypothetical protein